MKTRTLIPLFSITAIIIIVSIFYVYQLPHYSLEIQGMKDTYLIGEEYSFYYTLSGFGNTCHSWIVSYPNQNGEIKKAGEAVDCTRHTNKELSYDSRKDIRKFSSLVPEIEGKYNVTVSLENIEPTVYEFKVISSRPQEVVLPLDGIPTAQEFLKMNCEDLKDIFPEFPSKEVADAWNTRMHECINEQESLLIYIEPTGESGIDNKIALELENLIQMSCDEIIQRNNDSPYLSSDNREFAREKVLDCSDIEESFAVNASCEELYERYHSGQKYWFEDHKKITENRLTKCSSMIENEN